MPDPTKKRASKRERLAAAFRVRAGAIGMLTCCRCTYPLDQHATATRHALDCPAHAIELSAMNTTADHFSLAWTKSGPTEPTTKRTRKK